MKSREVTVKRPARGNRLWDEYEVDAYDTAAKGLVVHRDPLNRNRWVITHEKSGLPIHDGFDIKTRRAILEIAEKLTDTNWDVTYDEFDGSWEVYDRVCTLHKEAYEQQEGLQEDEAV